MSLRPQSSVYSRIVESSGLALTDDFTWWIVCRWQGLRTLENLYLDPSTHTSFCCSTFPCFQESYRSLSEAYDIYDSLAAEGPLAPPFSSAVHGETFGPPTSSFGFRQTQRFYQALTAHWFSTEALCLARVSVYPTTSERLKTFDQIESIWLGNPERTLSESLDVLETYDFVWGFLGRKIFADAEDFPSWIQGEHGSEFFLEGRDPHNEKWENFVKYIIQYLRPPNIIELLLWGWSQPCSLNRPQYLRRLGFFDSHAGTVLVEDDTPSPDSHFPLGLLEHSTYQRLQELDRTFDLDDVWQRYREKPWTRDARGKVLSWRESDGWLIERIKAAAGG